MKLEHRITVDAPRAKVWSVLMDLPVAARCVPGTRDIARDGDGVRGTLEVRVGPVKLTLRGTVAIESHDEAAGTARLRADAEDQRLGGGVRTFVDLAVSGDAPTDLKARTGLFTPPGRIRCARAKRREDFVVRMLIAGSSAAPCAERPR